MSPIAIKSFRTTPTKYYLNGPTLTYGVNHPSNVTVSNFGNTSFNASVSLTQPTTFPVPAVGVITYRWHDQNGPIFDESRVNGGDLGVTTYSGTSTTTLSISNAISPNDNNRQFYLVSYFEPQNNVGFQTFARALNSPLRSNIASLTVRPYLRIITQPSAGRSTVNDSATFNISVNVSDSSENISYQWRMNGSNLSNGTNGTLIVSGANTSTLTIRNTASGNYTIDCIVSHPSTDPGSITSSSTSFFVQDNVKYLFLEKINRESPENWMGSLPGERFNISAHAGGSPLTVTHADTDNRIIYIHAPDEDVDALVTMGAPAARDNGGQGGWMTFRYTFKRGVEHTVIIGSREGGGQSKYPIVNRETGNVTSGSIVGKSGAGSICFYKLNEIMAVCGGGGGGGDGGAGGDGAGANIPNGTRSGRKGFGVNGGEGGSDSPSDSSPGAIIEAYLDSYRFIGSYNNQDIQSQVVNYSGWTGKYGFVNFPDNLPRIVYGPSLSLDTRYSFIDYRSNRAEASKGSRVYVHPRGNPSWDQNNNSPIQPTSNDCYRFIGFDTSTARAGMRDRDTRNNESKIFTVADYAAGRSAFSNTGQFFTEYGGDFIGTIDYNNPNMQGNPPGTKIYPNMYWNKIGNGLGQTPGARVNFFGKIALIENVGEGDDYNSMKDGKSRRTKAICSGFERDEPERRFFVALNSAEIIRAYRVGTGGRANGGWSKFGGAGGGAGSQGGGCGAGSPNASGGGGGSGWADHRCQVLQTIDGGSIGEGFITIKAVNVNQPIESQLPNPPVSPNPNWTVLSWNDYRNYGWLRDSDGERWPKFILGEDINTVPFSEPLCTKLNDTHIQSPLVVKNNDFLVYNSDFTSLAYDSASVHLKGGLNESHENYHRLFYDGCRQDANTTSLASKTGGNLYFTGESVGGTEIYRSLRYNPITGLEQVGYILFELTLREFSVSQFESYQGSGHYLRDNRPRSSREFSESYAYSSSNPPSKYLLNDNGVTPKWNPYTDKKNTRGEIPFKSSDRWTSSFEEAYIPFEATFEMILEFDEILYHSDRSPAPSDIQGRYRRMVITKTYDFSRPWQKQDISFKSEDLWQATGTNGSDRRFIPPSSDIYNYRNPRIISWRISNIRDLVTGQTNRLNLYPVLGPVRPRDRFTASLEVGRGIFR